MNDDLFLQYGAIGAMALVCLIAVRVLFAQVVADKQRETNRADRAEEALSDLNRAVRDQVMPAVQDMTATAKALIELTAHERARRER